MPHARTLVVVTRKLPQRIEARMGELFDVRLNASDQPLDEDGLLEAVRTADVLVPTITDRIDRRLLERKGPRLRLIAAFANGVDNIDVEAAHACGITVTNTPGALTEDTADMTMALILAVSRRLVEGAAIVPAGRWEGWSPNGMLGYRITGKKLGILGMGRIGQAVARRARAFGLHIHYHNRRRVAPEAERLLEATYWESLDQMLARMDIVSVNCPHTPATFHLLSARRLALMRPPTVLVNTARGEVVDTKALVGLLEQGRLAGAGLDVYERGPAIPAKLLRLAKAGKVTLLPHMGSATLEGRLEMGERVLVNIQAFVDGHRPPDQVLPGDALDP